MMSGTAIASERTTTTAAPVKRAMPKATSNNLRVMRIEVRRKLTASAFVAYRWASVGVQTR